MAYQIKRDGMSNLRMVALAFLKSKGECALSREAR